MKINENWRFDDDALVIRQRHDAGPAIRSAKALRDQGHTGFADSVHVGRIPTRLYFEWAREAGVSPTDSDAMEQVLRRKMLDGSFSKFRIWEGTY